MHDRLSSLLREPLVHFLVLGLALFSLYGALHGGSSGPGAILVTQAQVEHLVLGFTRTWQRGPTQEELEGLIRDYVREEVYYREAMALGLDRDDTVIRRRLQQKLEFLSEDLATIVEPSDADLQAFLHAHPERFRSEPSLSFVHVYLNPQQHGKRLRAEAEMLLARLKKSGTQVDIVSLGDRFLLPSTFEAVSSHEIAQQFGEPFARDLGDVAPGEWHGPLESGYGLHLVFVSVRTEGGVPALEDIRNSVRQAWATEQREAANRALYQKLLERYTVTIERSQPAAAAPNGIAQR